MTVNIVINTIKLNVEMIRRFKWETGVDETGIISMNEDIIALIWECETPAIAETQAERLWSGLIGARIVADEEEANSFIRELIDLAVQGL